MKTIRFNSDNMLFYLLRHIQKQAKEKTCTDFVNWFVTTLILKEGNRKVGMEIHAHLKCKNDMVVMYKKLRNIEILPL